MEAAYQLVRARLMLVLLPFRRVAGRLGEAQRFDTHPDPVDALLLKRIRWALYAGSRHLPLRLVCLPRAVAAKAMLDRRHIVSTVHLGVDRDEGPDGLVAHAWVTVGDVVVCGREGLPRYTEVARFS